MRALAASIAVVLGLVRCDADPAGTDAGPVEPSADAASPGAPDAAGTSGCGVSAATGASNETIDIDGQTRSYVLSVPASYAPTKPTALVFGWHPPVETRSALGPEPSAL